MTTVDYFARDTRRSSRALAIAAARLGDFDSELDGTRAPSSTRIGAVLFWAAVLCLIAARVVLFDPAASRPVGSFPDLIAPTLSTR